MTRSISAAALAAALVPAAAPAAGGPALLVRMAAVNPTVHSYTATRHADVALRTFPFLSAALVGTLYHKEPDLNKVVFTSGVPAMASQFSKLFAHIESPSQWESVYTVTPASDDGKVTTFRLVPRKPGNVASIVATVDDKTALVQSMRWNYENGGYAEMHDRYGRVGDAMLVTSQTGHVEEPGYTADLTATIGGYTLNPKLSDSLFAS